MAKVPQLLLWPVLLLLYLQWLVPALLLDGALLLDAAAATAHTVSYPMAC